MQTVSGRWISIHCCWTIFRGEGVPGQQFVVQQVINDACRLKQTGCCIGRFLELKPSSERWPSEPRRLRTGHGVGHCDVLKHEDTERMFGNQQDWVVLTRVQYKDLHNQCDTKKPQQF